MKTTCSIRDESIFEGGRTDLRKMIHMYYLWSIGTSAKDCIRLCGIGGNRVHTYYKFLRQACEYYFEQNTLQLGGPGSVCEVDESLFSGRRKYNVGRDLLKIWVFGIADRSFVPARSYLVCVEKRDSDTLIPIIREVCVTGGAIHSDEWPAYKPLPKYGYEHKTVCHKRNLINPESGVHTQAIESLWNKCTCKIKAMHGVLRRCILFFL
ncbi:hypothetical protein ENBRE01_3008 [Enteropsectra breve]|nr:hypothetical protein ENBRE01_3008 [Enteropsectra breve]